MLRFNNLDERLELIVVAHARLHNVIDENICYGRKLDPKGRVTLLVNRRTQKNVSIIRKKLGLKDSLDAETWVGCFPAIESETKPRFIACADNSIEIALKVMPITVSELQNKGNAKYRPWKEIYVLERSTEIVQQGGIPNLPVLYGFSICKGLKKSDYLNKRLIDRMVSNPKEKFGQSAVIIFNELADYDMEYWIKHVFFDLPDPDVLRTAIFQVLAGLLALNSTIHLVQFDLHIGNILVSRIDSGGYFHYILNDNDYYIPNHGYLFKVWDFSRSILLEGDTRDIIIKKVLFHGKRFFGQAFQKKTANVVYNIDSSTLGRFLDYLYSFDTFKFAKTLYTAVRIKQEATTSRGLKKNPQLARILDILLQITKSAQADLLKRLTLSKEPKKFIYEGIPKVLLHKYFSQYRKKPEKSLIVNKGSPFVVN